MTETVYKHYLGQIISEDMHYFDLWLTLRVIKVINKLPFVMIHAYKKHGWIVSQPP